MNFKETNIENLHFNPFIKIGTDWMLITAGDKKNFNTMTASWGGVGVFWGKNIVILYIRPQRYTREFIENNDYLTLSFFKPEYKKALNICGTLSGRDTDKISKAGLTPYFIDGTTAFKEANEILVCKKLYKDTMPPKNFIAKENDEKWYPDKDYHFMYIAEIKRFLVKE